MNVPAETGGHVLAVDDSHANLRLLTRMLEVESHLVQTAADGMSALAAIEAHSPEVILLDVRLPDIDGFEVCRRLKRNASTRLTPVIMMSGLDSREQRLEAVNAGADEFLGKPFDPAQVRACVRSLLQLKRYTDGLDSSRCGGR